MKIGILTFHCAYNYGAILQCYGLQQYLKSLGHNVFVIDYRPSYLVKGYRRHSWRNWICSNFKLTLHKLKTEPFLWSTRSLRYDTFCEFINNNLKLYPYYKGMDYSEFDALILGSDQIWEAPITGGKFDPVYFGEDAKCKIISYAASNKSNELSSAEKQWYKRYLSSFYRIGVRERTLQCLLSSFIEKPVFLNVDPTILASNYLLDSIKNNQKAKDKYVVVYEIVEHQEVFDIAKDYANNINARVIILDAEIKADNKSLRDQTASPEDFVNYIRYAECVFTTSFHGTAISILCKTNFYSFKQHNSSDQRISSLLEQLDLSNRFVEMHNTPKEINIDYSKIVDKLKELTNASREYVQDALS